MALHYKQPRNIKHSFVQFVNKIFSLNSQWLNEDVEVVELTEDNSPDAFEQYPWDNEKYPLVVLFSDGSTDDRWAIDERIADHREYLELGSVARSYVQLGPFSPSNSGLDAQAVGMQPLISSMILKSVDLLMKYTGPYEEAITIKIWEASGDLPGTLLASGSIKGEITAGIEWLQTNIKPEITLAQNTKYFISAQAPSGSYQWFIDDDPNTSRTPYIRHAVFSGSTGAWSGVSSQSPIAKAHGPAVRRLGGGLNSTVRMFVEAKDLSTTQKITDLLFVYMHLAKHSNVGRREKLTEPNVTSMDLDFVSDLSDEGIYIIDVNKGAETVRTRGNDRLFSVDLSLTCYSSWSEDFVLPVIEDIGIEPDIESVIIVSNKYI